MKSSNITTMSTYLKFWHILLPTDMNQTYRSENDNMVMIITQFSASCFRLLTINLLTFPDQANWFLRYRSTSKQQSYATYQRLLRLPTCISLIWENITHKTHTYTHKTKTISRFSEFCSHWAINHTYKWTSTNLWQILHL